MGDHGLSFQAGKKKGSSHEASKLPYFNDVLGKRLLDSESDFSGFTLLSKARQKELTDLFKSALGIPANATVEFERKSNGTGVVLTGGPTKAQKFLRADVKMPGDSESNHHVVRVYLSPAARLNKFFIDQQLVPRSSEQGIAGTIMEKLAANKSENGEHGSIALVATNLSTSKTYLTTAARHTYIDTKNKNAVTFGFRFQVFEVSAKGEFTELDLLPKSKEIFKDQLARITLETRQGTLSFPNNMGKGLVTFNKIPLTSHRMEGRL